MQTRLPPSGGRNLFRYDLIPDSQVLLFGNNSFSHQIVFVSIWPVLDDQAGLALGDAWQREQITFAGGIQIQPLASIVPFTPTFPGAFGSGTRIVDGAVRGAIEFLPCRFQGGLGFRDGIRGILTHFFLAIAALLVGLVCTTDTTENQGDEQKGDWPRPGRTRVWHRGSPETVRREMNTRRLGAAQRSYSFSFFHR
jgi:hypothetical protein